MAEGEYIWNTKQERHTRENNSNDNSDNNDRRKKKVEVKNCKKVKRYSNNNKLMHIYIVNYYVSTV